MKSFGRCSVLLFLLPLLVSLLLLAEIASGALQCNTEPAADQGTVDPQRYLCSGFADGDNFPDFVDLDKDKITEIHIINGNLNAISNGAVLNFPNLRIFNITDNKVLALERDIFQFVPNLMIIDVSVNSISCGESLQWLNEWRLLDSNRKVVGECTSHGDITTQYLEKIRQKQNNLTFDMAVYNLQPGITQQVLKIQRSGDTDTPMTINVKADAGLQVPSNVSSEAGLAPVNVTVDDWTVSGVFAVTLVPQFITFPTAQAQISYSFDPNFYCPDDLEVSLGEDVIEKVEGNLTLVKESKTDNTGRVKFSKMNVMMITLAKSPVEVKYEYTDSKDANRKVTCTFSVIFKPESDVYLNCSNDAQNVTLLNTDTIGVWNLRAPVEIDDKQSVLHYSSPSGNRISCLGAPAEAGSGEVASSALAPIFIALVVIVIVIVSIIIVVIVMKKKGEQEVGEQNVKYEKAKAEDV